MKRIYELVVLAVDGTDEKKVESIVSGLLAKSGGKSVKFDFWGKKQLMYPISKQNRAVFGLFELEMEPKEVLELQKRLKLEDEVLRYLLVVKNQRIKKEK